MSPPVIIVTNCTNRKRSDGEFTTLPEADRRGSLEQVARRWAKALKKAPAANEARNLYAGRSIQEAKNAARVAGATLYVVSAGLGLVHELERIPAYDLTVAAGPGSIAPYLATQGKTPADWWRALTSELGVNRCIRSLYSTNRDKTILLALPAGYLELIAGDLEELTPKQVERTRIITSRLGAEVTPPKLRQVVLPYDERLEGLRQYAGTRTDFPQRALLHFIQELDGHRRDFETARASVQFEMSNLKKREIPSRAKKSDEEITALLRKNWDRCDGASSRLLRLLRDDEHVACEQSRFRSLWLQLQQELNIRG